MIKIQIDRMSLLPCGVKNIKDFALHGCDFFFLERDGCKMIKWCSHKNTIEEVNLERKYACICYDNKDRCYWAASACEPLILYRLDLCFHEVGHLTVGGIWQQQIMGLSCDCNGEGLWVTYPCQVDFIEKCSAKVSRFENEDTQRSNLSVLSQDDCKVISYAENRREFIEVVSTCHREQFELCIPKSYKIVSSALKCSQYTSGECQFYVLLWAACSSELMLAEYSVCFCEEWKPCMENACEPKPQICHKPCPAQCCAGYEIMHSIALEEAGIAHILNAEGEKIQKAVALSDNIEDLICVNESVKHTLTQVTQLEGQLYAKLEALVSLCDFQESSPCSECDR